jgi:hypothetical protein
MVKSTAPVLVPKHTTLVGCKNGVSGAGGWVMVVLNEVLQPLASEIFTE